MSMSIPGNSCRTSCYPVITGGCAVRLAGTCVYYSGLPLSGPGINTGDVFNTVVEKLTNYITAGPGTVTSVAATIPSGAISIAGSPITSSGTLAFTYTGNTSQYIRGDGSLATFPTVSANDGLSVSSNVVKLGQTVGDVTNPAALTANREIPTNSFSVLFTGTGRVAVGTSTPNSTHKLTVIATGTDRAMNASAVTGNALNAVGTGASSTVIFAQAQGSGGTAVSGSSTNAGVAVQGSASNSGIGGRFYNVEQGGTPDPIALLLERLPTGSGVTNGNGLTIMFRGSYTNGSSGNEMGRIRNYYTDAVAASAKSSFDMYLVHNAVSARKLLLTSTGQLTLDAYGSGTFTGTPTYSLQVDSSGNIIEGEAIASAANGLMIDTGVLVFGQSAIGSGDPALFTNTRYLPFDFFNNNSYWHMQDITHSELFLEVGPSFLQARGSLTYSSPAIGIQESTTSTYFQVGINAANVIDFTSSSGASLDILLPIRLDPGGAFGTSATAYLQIAAGTATANTAPLKFTSGTNLTTAETGAIEYNGTNLFFTRTGTTRETIWTGNSGAAAPATGSGGLIANWFGTDVTTICGNPNAWASVVIGGVTYKIPLYT